MAFFGRRKADKVAMKPGKGAFAVNGSVGHILRVNWLGLKIADITGEAIFFEERLGLHPQSEGNSRDGHHVLYKLGAIYLELYEGGVTWALQPKPRDGAPDVPLVPGFLVNDIERVAMELHDKEVAMTQVFEQGWVSSFLFSDAERVLWQVSQIHNQPKVGTDKLEQLGVLWLAAEDLEAQTAFYRDVIGLPLVDVDDREHPITEQAERYQAEEPREEALSEGAALVKPRGAVFFESGVRLAITGGGKTLDDKVERVWGRDNRFMGGFQAYQPLKLAERLKGAGVKVEALSRNDNSGRGSFRFTDPEGHVWKVSD